MILRRFAQSLKDQNWTAIAIEFVLLVLGVFLGIQVANWNEERLDHDRERSFLVQLREEIGDNIASIEHQLRYQNEVIASGRRALAFLQSDGRCTQRCSDLLVDFFHASQMWGTPYARGKYEENQRLGFPTRGETRAAVDEFYFFIDGWDAVTATAPPYREGIRSHFSPDAAEHLWRACWRSVNGHLEELTRDCRKSLNSLDITPMLASIHADANLTPQLRFWIGQNIFATRAFPEALRHAKAAVAAIDADIGMQP